MTNELSNEEAVAIIDKMLADDEMVLDILTEIEAEALRMGAEALRALTWQPIETAPKDGFHLHLYAPELQFVGFWSGREWCVVAPHCPVAPTQPTLWRSLYAAPQPQGESNER